MVTLNFTFTQKVIILIIILLLTIPNIIIIKYNNKRMDDDNVGIIMENNITVFNQSLSKFEFFIFQIGFYKAGTTSLSHYFRANGIPCAHFHVDKITGMRIYESILDYIMFNNYKNNLPILTNYHNKYRYYGDFGTYIHGEGHKWDILYINQSIKSLYINHINNIKYESFYEILTKQYKNSLFILNIRQINHWLKSQYTYSRKPKQFGFIVNHIKGRWPNVFKTDIDVIRGWKIIWYRYICRLLTYFKINKFIHRLIIFEIDKDNVTKLVNFFKKYNLNLNQSISFINIRSTSRQIKGGKLIKEMQKKWDNITAEYQEFSIENDGIDAYQEIENQCNVKIRHLT